MNKRLSLLSLLPAALHAAALFLILFALVSPAPFGASSVSLLVVQPSNLNSSSGNTSTTSAGDTYTISVGGNVSSSATVSASRTSAASVASSSNISTSLSSTTPTSTAASSTSSSAVAATTSLAAREVANSRHAYVRLSKLVRREAFTNSTGPDGLALNATGATSTANSVAQDVSSKVRWSYGPLGSCFRSAKGVKTCTSARLSASFDTSGLAAKGLGFSTTGLPTSITTTPSLLLAVLVIVIVTLAVWLPPLLAAALPQKFGAFLESGPRERALRTAGKAAFWALIAAWFLLVGTTISMRIKASRAVTSFNSANSGRGLPSAAVEDASNGEKMTLEASKGSAFGMLWSAALLLLAVILLERRRARRADAVAQARADIEAQAGRKVWEAPGQPPSAAPCPAQPALSAPIPLEYTRTASPAPTYFTGSERRVDMEGEALTWRLVGDKTGQLYN